MGRISPYIKEGAKISVLGTVLGENIARPHLGNRWKTSRLFGTILREAPGNNRWVITLDIQPEAEIEVSAGRIKFEATAVTNDEELNIESDVHEELSAYSSETDMSSSSSQSENEIENVSNTNDQSNILWTDAIVTIDSRQMYRSYSSEPVVNIANISNASPRQFFERFIPVDYIMSVVIPSTNQCAHASERLWKDLTWMEFMRFVGILTIMTYIRCSDICDYWSTKAEIGSVALTFGQYMSHKRFRDIIKYLTLSNIATTNDDPDAFNENLSKAITPGSSLCIDESMCQWMGKIDKGPFQRKIPRKPHPIGLATMLRLTEPWFHSGRTVIADSWFGNTNACTTLYKYGLYSILQLKKRRYWPKNIPSDITSALNNDYGSSISRVRKLDGIDLTVCSIRDRKNIVLLSNCSITSPGTEITRYIEGHGSIKFQRPTIFDEFNEFRSAVDILNNLRDNALSYHDVLTTKRSADRIFAFYFTVAEANSFSAYCRFVPGKQNMKHTDFRKHLVKSIFDCYLDTTIADRTKKKRKLESDNFEHNLLSLKCDPATKKLKGKRLQRHCLGCHKRTTTCCSCQITRAICTNCWANHIREMYSTVST
ncbi:41709_t:CDS:2, partial [Gigaspora margarita]